MCIIYEENLEQFNHLNYFCFEPTLTNDTGVLVCNKAPDIIEYLEV